MHSQGRGECGERVEPRVKLLGLLGEIENLHSAVDMLKPGRFVSGGLVAGFESEWADYCSASFCIACGSGGQALSLVLRALDVPQGAYVLLPAFSFAATAMAVMEAGLRPVYCDVDSRGLMDEVSARRVYEEYEPWVIVPVHLYGQMVDMDWVMDLAGRAYVVEDAAQAHGSLKQVRGHAACFSFYPSKNLGACGEAGSVLTNDRALAFRVRAMTNYGVRPGTKHEYILHGGNYKMDEIQAAVLVRKLRSLSWENWERGVIAEMYWERGVKSYVRDSNYHLYPILVDNPVEVAERMLLDGVETGCHYPYILPHLASLRQSGSWPNALEMSARTLSLPMGLHLGEDDIDKVVEAFKECSGVGLS